MHLPAAGAALGIPGLYVTGDPGGIDEAAKKGALSLSLGTGWAKSLSFTTGQCPVMKYNRGLMMAILHDKVQIAKNVNAKSIPLEDAPKGYAEFDAGAAPTSALNPHGSLGSASGQAIQPPSGGRMPPLEGPRRTTRCMPFFQTCLLEFAHCWPNVWLDRCY